MPKRDEAGKPYCDFMMLAPGLNKRPVAEVDSFLRLMRGTLAQFGEVVVFADFNLSMNVLWVSYQYHPGLMPSIVAVLQARLPLLRLVAHNPHI